MNVPVRTRPARLMFREDLERHDCDVAGCKNTAQEIYLHAGCHLGAALEVAYQRDMGCIKVRCNHCKKVLCAVAVASRSGS